MAEEHRCQAPEGHRLCANNCGIFGSAATMNLCSKCYGDYCLKEQQQQKQEASIKAALSLPIPTSSSPVVVNSGSSASTKVDEVVSPATVQANEPNRCSACRKRVGLTGFRCRCESMFCCIHRYPEKHNCSFDFKKKGREEIARANPLVVAEKLHRI